MRNIFVLILLCCSLLGFSQETGNNAVIATAPANGGEVIAQEENIAESSDNWIQKVENWYASNMNYGSIVALMTIESSFIPFPSEVVIPPAAYVAGNEGSCLNKTASYPLNVLIIVLFGTLGAMFGAIINYCLALWLGRPIIYAFADSKVGRWMLLSSEKIQKAEDYFNQHGKGSTFFGRLIPAIRQLISIPAGLARMNFGQFLLFTFLGAFFWNIVLALLGYLAQGQSDLINKYSDELSYIILVVVVVVAVILIARAIIKKKKSTSQK